MEALAEAGTAPLVWLARATFFLGFFLAGVAAKGVTGATGGGEAATEVGTVAGGNRGRGGGGRGQVLCFHE